jgi:hypothetical protein
MRKMQQTRSRALALGPNPRSRLAWLAGITGGMFVVACVAHYAAGIGNSSTRHRPQFSLTRNSSAQPQQRRYGEFNLGIAYGTAPKQVLRQLGSPTKKQADCWLYRGHVGKIRGRYPGPYVDAVKFCFAEGAPSGGRIVAQILSHRVSHSVTHSRSRRTIPAFWGWPTNRGAVPDWYLHENS